ncbi:hypothetical protein OU789_07495 [Halocynthiibacter sp. C4]|uniref:hypothetical protein n=1 Tax=Halocynthiibacter sp. C4 TaxID=2992758 RepID=UPI00237C3DE3|nr:hypothetical protein [Halocynthiibacter sp. C4]MDE0589763.1 hypothetical protein [Halocynthiibacter sp. C4]
MIDKTHKNTTADPKGLIRESFRIEGISSAECRSIFIDWSLSLPNEVDPKAAIAELLEQHKSAPEDHPMLEILRDGLLTPEIKGRRGGRKTRVKS